MKKSIWQKTLAALLCIMMLAAMLLPSSAADDLSSHLVTWWDFEGDTLEERLSDKAPAGKAKDTIYTEGDSVKIADGVAYVPHDPGNILHADKTDDTTDFNKKTIYFRLKLDGYAMDSADFVEIPGTLRFFCDKDSFDGSHTFTGRALAEVKKGIRQSDYAYTDNKVYQYFATSMTLDAAGKLVVTTYTSMDAKEFIACTYEFADVTTLSNAGTMNFGKTIGALNLDRGINYTFDEIRIYDKALTEEEVKTIAAAAPAAPVTPAADVSSSLVGYWDFEGATKADQLADKSTAGKVADTLEAGGDKLTIKDGVAHVPQDKGNYLLVNKSDDIGDLSNATLYFKLKMTGFHTGTAAGEIFNANKVTRTFYWPNTVIQSWCYGSANFKTQNTTFKYDTTFDSDFYYAMTISTANGKTTFSLYLSRDGKTYEKADATFDSADNVIQKYITFGKTDKNTEARGIDFYFDEIRIYNKALTADEIASLSAAPAVAETTKAPDTTAAPTTTAAPVVTTAAPAQTPATADVMPVMLLCAAAAVVVLVSIKKRT